MEESQNIKKHTLSDYIDILFRWKKFIIINIAVVIIITSIITLLIPNTYRATAVFMSTPDNSLNLGSLAGLMSSKSSSASFGAKLLGISSSSDDIIYGLLNSRTVLLKTIKDFNLQEYYKLPNIDKTIKRFSSDLSFEPTDYSMIEVGVVNENPVVSAQIANYLTNIVDSLNIQINIRQAKSSREFIGKRYLQNVLDLKNAEDSLNNFQKESGVIVIPQQLEIEVKTAAELEAQLVQKQLVSDLFKKQFGISSPQYNDASTQVDFLKNKIDALRNSKTLGESSNYMLPFKDIPELSLKYFRFYREIELQSKIMEFILPIYEQAKVDEQKSMPTIYVVDKATPPQVKYGPKRSLIVAGITLISLFIIIIICFQGEYILKNSNLKNSLEEKEASFFSKVKKIYKLKNL